MGACKVEGKKEKFATEKTINLNSVFSFLCMNRGRILFYSEAFLYSCFLRLTLLLLQLPKSYREPLVKAAQLQSINAGSKQQEV